MRNGEARLSVTGQVTGRQVKCLVWDLDDTLWEGVLAEGDDVRLLPGVVEVIDALDRRGILQSIASRNEYDHVMTKLDALKLREFFLYPQIGWGSKVGAIETIAGAINIGLDAMALIDDQVFEREEVRYSLPQVLCIDARDLDKLLDMPAMNPTFITKDSKRRRWMCQSDLERRKAEDEFVGPNEEFLATLGMRFSIFPAREDDLKRAEELTVRTNQLNATGRRYSYEELDRARVSQRHILLISSLEDRFGTYGRIGLALVECADDAWTLMLLLMSCRVMSRGVGTIMLHQIMRMARERGVRLLADFVPTDRNRMMFITYKFAGFREVDKIGDLVVLEHDLEGIPPFPDSVKVEVELE